VKKTARLLLPPLPGPPFTELRGGHSDAAAATEAPSSPRVQPSGNEREVSSDLDCTDVWAGSEVKGVASSEMADASGFSDLMQSKPCAEDCGSLGGVDVGARTVATAEDAGRRGGQARIAMSTAAAAWQRTVSQLPTRLLRPLSSRRKSMI